MFFYVFDLPLSVSIQSIGENNLWSYKFNLTKHFSFENIKLSIKNIILNN